MEKDRLKEQSLMPYIILVIVIISVLLILVELWSNVSGQIYSALTGFATASSAWFVQQKEPIWSMNTSDPISASGYLFSSPAQYESEITGAVDA